MRHILVWPFQSNFNRNKMTTQNKVEVIVTHSAQKDGVSSDKTNNNVASHSQRDKWFFLELLFA